MKKVRYTNVVEIPVDQIEVSELNIRRYYNQATLHELGQSMDEAGTLHPVFVRPKEPEKYELVVGSRRLRAAEKLRLVKIPAVVLSDLDDRQMLELALAENLHREDLTPFEEGWVILKLTSEYKMSLYEVSERIKRPEDFVSRRLRLMSMPKEVQELVSQHKINLAVIDTLARVGTPEDQVQFAKTAAKHNLAPDELSTLIKKEMGSARGSVRRSERTRLTGKRVSLWIESFGRRLDRDLPTILEMGRRDKAYVRSAIEQLQERLKYALREIDKPSK